MAAGRDRMGVVSKDADNAALESAKAELRQLGRGEARDLRAEDGSAHEPKLVDSLAWAVEMMEDDDG